MRRLARWMRRTWILWHLPVERKPEPLVIFPPTHELVEARFALWTALDEVPRDQKKVNRLRERVRLLTVPNDSRLSGIHRRGITR